MASRACAGRSSHRWQLSQAAAKNGAGLVQGHQPAPWVMHRHCSPRSAAGAARAASGDGRSLLSAAQQAVHASMLRLLRSVQLPVKHEIHEAGGDAPFVVVTTQPVSALGSFTQQQSPTVPAAAKPSAAASAVVTGEELTFARRYATACNGSAPAGERARALGELMLDARRQQAAFLSSCNAAEPMRLGPGAWLSAPGGVLLLERVYMLGAVLAELGAALDAAGASLLGSAPARVAAALDYGALLSRYLDAHGALLEGQFCAGLQDHRLQAEAIAVASALQARSVLQPRVVERLLACIGTEGGAPGRGSAAVNNNTTTVNNNTTTLLASHVTPWVDGCAASATDARGEGGVKHALVGSTLLLSAVAVVAAGLLRGMVAAARLAGTLAAALMLLCGATATARSLAAFVQSKVLYNTAGEPGSTRTAAGSTVHVALPWALPWQRQRVQRPEHGSTAGAVQQGSPAGSIQHALHAGSFGLGGAAAI